MIMHRSVSDLIAETRTALEPFGYRPSTTWQLEYAWRLFEAYGVARGTTTFSTGLAAEYLQELRQQYEDGAVKMWRFKLARKALALLMQQWETGEVQWNHLPAWGRADTPPHHVAVLARYAGDLTATGYGRGTQDVYLLVARQFLQYLDREQVPTLAAAALKDVSGFIPAAGTIYQPTSMRTVLSALRHFLRWAAETRDVPRDLTSAVPRSGSPEMVPVFSGTEEQRLLGSFDRATPIGRRDYAICLLALRLGLRAGDIVRLHWADLDWRRQTLSVVQEKTGRRLTTPLLADVGNALIDYGLRGRPPSDSPVVFLRSQAPHRPLACDSAVYHVVAAAMARAGIRQAPGDRRGPHALRHSLASRLLAAETSLPVIASVLGHGDKETTTVYLSTDVDHLRACALDLAAIPVTREELRP